MNTYFEQVEQWSVGIKGTNCLGLSFGIAVYKLGKSLNPSLPQLPHLQNREYNGSYLVGLYQFVLYNKSP
jgi:hypothetical protein